jgi:hypothetical protein
MEATQSATLSLTSVRNRKTRSLPALSDVSLREEGTFSGWGRVLAVWSVLMTTAQIT